MMIEAYIPDSSVPAYYGSDEKPASNFPFNFHMLNVRDGQNATEVLNLIDSWWEVLPEGRWSNSVVSTYLRISIKRFK